LNDQVSLRKIVEDDGPELYQWVMDKETRANAPDSTAFSSETHMNWLKEKIKSKNSLILIGEIDEFPVGQIRFDFEFPNGIWMSIVVNPVYRGKGIGKRLIRDGIEWMIHSNPMRLKGKFKLWALLKASNLASKSIFETNGFGKVSTLRKIKGVAHHHYRKLITI